MNCVAYRDLVGEGHVNPERFNDVATNVRYLSSNLEGLADSISKQTASLQNHAPTTVDAAYAFAACVVSSG